ncbi:hypothetical protein DXG03_004549 [Asterophora parasitica]|uniref:Uncharacterized protein n=1 Tax=Asterophora parasitica TaxID=117018 RepID=A0A9P7K6U4_9AGAR|nr:hypothetical protein DXG03_004549 [Asterophora parasitica]
MPQVQPNDLSYLQIPDQIHPANLLPGPEVFLASESPYQISETNLNDSESGPIETSTPSSLHTKSTSRSPFNIDDVKTEYHPHSGRAPKFETFKEYDANNQTYDNSVPQEGTPWAPFRSRLDFEVAELALDAALSTKQLEVLVKLMRRAAEDNPQDPFTLKSSGEVKKLWDLASEHRTGVRNMSPLDLALNLMVFFSL